MSRQLNNRVFQLDLAENKGVILDQTFSGSVHDHAALQLPGEGARMTEQLGLVKAFGGVRAKLAHRRLLRAFFYLSF